MNPVKQPRWKTVEYTRSQIMNTGKIIRKCSENTDEYKHVIDIIDNWRASHAYPLHIIYMHLRHMCESDKTIVVAERLKRLDSIKSKLLREKNMNLWTMQDLGGCRVIVNTIENVYKYSDRYEQSRKRHIKKREYDYIKNPKASGYRSLHVVYEYKSDSVDTYNRNMLIEIQYRTRLQHLWATAVETMGLFTKEAIKSGQGSEDVKRFFVLVSALFAIREKQPMPPNVIGGIDEIVSEIASININHNYLDFLSGISVAVDKQEYKLKKSNVGYCILILNYNTKLLRIMHFKSSEIDKANKIYNAIESTRAESKIDAVLVRVSSFKSLKKAFPNYFSDIGKFVSIIKLYLKYNASFRSEHNARL